MPLLLRRRSVLDILNIKADDQNLPRPESSTSQPELPSPSRPASQYHVATSRLSHELQPNEVLGDAAPGAGSKKAAKRLSLLKFRNFSESHLALRAREDAAKETVVPPLPSSAGNDTVPAIVRTAPTMEASGTHEEAERHVRPSLFQRSMSKRKPSQLRSPRKSSEQNGKKSVEHQREERTKGHSSRWRGLQGRSTGLEDLARLATTHTANSQQDHKAAPPSYGDVSQSALALPVPEPRFSESSRSDDSNGDQVYGSMTTTTHTVSTHTTFFKLPRRNNNNKNITRKSSLFPLPAKLPPPSRGQDVAVGPATPRASTSARSISSMQTPNEKSSPATVLQRRYTAATPTKHSRSQRLPPLPSPQATLARSSLSLAEPGIDLSRNDGQQSPDSSSPSHAQAGVRERVSTTNSFGRASHDMDMPPGPNGSARNSTSTTGRSSLGGFLNLARFRQGSDPHSPRHGSPDIRSKSNSFAMSREALVIPEREEGDTPGKYLERLEAAVARSMIAGILSKSSDPFAQSVLRSYTRRFRFFGEPIDMSLRKFLLEAELPKETQQVDRVIQAFADRYHECNPGIFIAAEQAYIIAFSLMMLHTDAFNKNNKRKMQKGDYIKNTSGQQVADDVLACFYDNICYTPFVHYEEEVDINGERVLPFKPKKSKLKGAIQDGSKKPSGPVDPYNLLVDHKLELLRPPIKESITLDDPYDYRTSQGGLDPTYLQRAFTHTGVLQIISARSRPAAYEGHLGNSNPVAAETQQAGIVDLKITKIGTLWRKAAKKKKTRSPWQEWGAVLTGSQLYLFKNAHWAKGLVGQFVAQQKHGQPRTPVIFKPPLHDFKPDALIKTDDAVALVDSTYNRHKNAFTFFRAGAHEEVLLADNENELNEWLSLINYAAAFRAAGVRIRGMVGGNEEDLRRRDVQRLNSTRSTRSVQTATGEVTVSRGGLSPQLQRQVMAARRQIMVQKIAETEKEIGEASRQLDGMLRTGRHLMILAPIAPKSRDDIMHAAARSDAMIKWARRSIWRMRCHRDILAMDVQQDGLPAVELQSISIDQQAQAQQQADESTAKKGKGSALLRLGSKASAPVPARSPPQSPTSPSSRRSARRNTADSVDTVMGTDVLRTQSESTTDSRPGVGLGLVSSQLDPQQRTDEHRVSVADTLLTVSSPGRGSLSQASSTSSVYRVERLDSSNPSEASANKDHAAPTSRIEPQEVQLLARASRTPESTVSGAPLGLSLDGTPTTSTPDSKSKGVRRSLQRTLRDAHHHSHAGGSHKHRRGKESDGTIRSAGGENGDEAPEGTPGLQREKGRFILHGKQASVIQFDSDWPSERMRIRRQQWRQSSSESVLGRVRSRRMSRAEWSESLSSPVVRELAQVGGESEGESASEAESSDTARSQSLTKQDVEAALDTLPRPTEFSFEAETRSYIDLASWDPDSGKRMTVIGPRLPGRSGTSLQKAEDGGVESDVEDFSLGPRENRKTVLGPSPSPSVGLEVVNGGETSSRKASSATASTTYSRDARAGAEEHEERGNEEVDGGGMVAAHIDDEELRKVSAQSARVPA